MESASTALAEEGNTADIAASIASRAITATDPQGNVVVLPPGTRVLDARVALASNDFGLLVETGLMMAKYGENDDALKLLRQACSVQPDHQVEQVHSVLIRLVPDISEKIVHAARMTELRPSDPFSWLLLGNYQDDNGDFEAALSTYRRGIDADPSQYRNVISCCRILAKLGRDDETLDIVDAAVARGVLNDRWQRPSHFVPGLSFHAWRDEVCNWRVAKVLESNFQTIRDEAMGLLESGRLAKEGILDTEDLATKGEWKELNLIFQGITQVHNCDLCPHTAALIENELPEAASFVRGSVKFSVLSPGSVVKPHHGPSNTRMRTHLGIRVPEGCFIRAGDPSDPANVRQWEEGRVLCFDDSYRHEVWHEGTETRLVLICDVWHPDLDHQARLMSCENQFQQQVYLARYSGAKTSGKW